MHDSRGQSSGCLRAFLAMLAAAIAGSRRVGIAAGNAFTLTGAAIFAAETASPSADLKLPANFRAPPICETKASPAAAGAEAPIRSVARTTVQVRILPHWHDAHCYRVSLNDP